MDSKSLYQLTRIKIFYGILALVIPVVYAYPNINWSDIGIMFSCAFTILLGVHVADDIYGYLNRTDILNAEQKKRIGEPKPLVSGKATLQEATLIFFILFFSAFILGLYLVIQHGLVLLIMGAFTAGWGVSYSKAPFKLSYRGLGESVLVVCGGVMPVTISYFIISHSFSIEMTLIGLGLGLIFASVLTRSNLADVRGDLKTNRWTLTAILFKRYGRDSVNIVHFIIMSTGSLVLIYGMMILLGAIGIMIGVVSSIFIFYAIMLSHEPETGRKIVFHSYLSHIIVICVLILVNKWWMA